VTLTHWSWRTATLFEPERRSGDWSAPAPGAMDRALAIQWRRRKRFTAGWVRGRVRVRRGARRTAAGAAAIPIHFHCTVPFQSAPAFGSSFTFSTTRERSPLNALRMSGGSITRAEAAADFFGGAEAYHNRAQRHDALGFINSVDFELQLNQTQPQLPPLHGIHQSGSGPIQNT
jgi:hypothetical protein